MNKIMPFLIFFLAVVLLTACGAFAPVPESEPLTEPASDSIVGIVWLWESVYNRETNETDTVPDPENYTIQFKEDGTFTGQADCNAISGTYSQENGFTITLGPSTLAFCGEASLDQVYLELLNNIVAGGPDGAGGLALETPAGENRMQFVE